MDLVFEWDEEKARRNEAKHGVTFEEARTILNDPFAMTVSDHRFPQSHENGREGIRTWANLIATPTK